ncbi:hypothetical protein THAR02_06362 [Trichoderma harzianum]|uniref:Uncharacterized protein n=1 Tax=Trichoderma harzianum TaxID=5544 RepID=A0A0F9XAP9_TRIHA|nr:hypothetical protein THAR02_06362 [Trichoderma harzianum]
MSTLHHKDLERFLVDNDIFPEGYHHPNGDPTPKPSNLDQLLEDLSVIRYDLRGDSTGEFRTFQQMNNSASRSTIMRRVIPILEGCAGTDTMNDGDIELDNLAPLVEDIEVELRPDYFDGAPFTSVYKQVRDDLGGIIIPSTDIRVPVAPNFFLEVRRPSGNAVTTKVEACYYGACGARLMNALQNYFYGGDHPYDSYAHCFSATYINGLLKIYAHFTTSSDSTAGASPAYHMFELKAFNMTSSHEDFIAGCAAFRNARDMAAKVRNCFIVRANEDVSEYRLEQDVNEVAN